MADVKYKFTRGTTSNLASTNRVDGQILLDTTLQKIGFDVKPANSNTVERFWLDTDVNSISEEFIYSLFEDDDILVYSSLSDFPNSGATDKTYYASDTRKFYKWNGTTYVEYDVDDSTLVYKIDDATANAIADADYIPFFDISANTKKRIAFDKIKEIMGAVYENKAAAENGTDLSLVTTGDKYNWDHKTSNSGTVTSVTTGVGLSGGNITTSGTIKVKLKSETASSLESASMGSISGRQYAVGVDKDGYLSVNVPWENDNTWTANSSSAAGYVASGSGQNKKAWMTDASGNPAWRDYDEMTAIAEAYVTGLFDDDDILVYSTSSSFPATGNSSKLYYAIDTKKFYKWNGTTYVEYDVANGTVRSVTAGVGLAGGTIYDTGTIKANLKSETASSLTAASKGSTANREYAVGVDASGNLSVNIPWTDTVYTPPTVYSQTLAAGSTSVTFTDLPTTGTNLFDVYTSVAGLDYEDMTASNNGTSLTITYEAQSSSVIVYLRVDHR